MNIREAKICPKCDEVYAGKQCPRCQEEQGVYLSRWVPPSQPKPKEPSKEAMPV